jgi:isopentenyldiphosphate isomerase
MDARVILVDERDNVIGFQEKFKTHLEGDYIEHSPFLFSIWKAIYCYKEERVLNIIQAAYGPTHVADIPDQENRRSKLHIAG